MVEWQAEETTAVDAPTNHLEKLECATERAVYGKQPRLRLSMGARTRGEGGSFLEICGRHDAEMKLASARLVYHPRSQQRQRVEVVLRERLDVAPQLDGVVFEMILRHLQVFQG